MDKQYIIEKIQELISGKHCAPQGVLYSKLKTSVQRDLSNTLGEMFKLGEISYNKTLNDILINIKK